jgi:hypothetical protein
MGAIIPGCNLLYTRMKCKFRLELVVHISVVPLILVNPCVQGVGNAPQAARRRVTAVAILPTAEP